MHLLISKSWFKFRLRSLQPTWTIPHTPHAASYIRNMTNGVCLTQCALSLNALLTQTDPISLPREIPVITAPFWSGCWSAITSLDMYIMSFLPWQAADDATMSCGDAGAVQTSSKLPHISRVVTIANTAAMSFLAR